MKWLKSKFRSKRKATAPVKEGPGTPSPLATSYSLMSQRSNVTVEIVPQQQAMASPFFQKLPGELRHQIYLAAFANQTIHIDAISRLDFHFHAGRHARLNSTFWPEWDNFSQWKLKGSVCHRKLLAEPYLDECYTGVAYCDMYAGELPGKCFPGVIGWILSCRQAYVHNPYSRLPSNKVTLSYYEILLFEICVLGIYLPSIDPIFR